MPPATWEPSDEWLPAPDWPEPPADWRFWSVPAPQPASGEPQERGKGGRLGKVSFPVATVAAQSTVSLGALFSDRGRRAPDGTYGTSSGGVAGEPATTARHEYHEPPGRGVSAFGSDAPPTRGSVLDGLVAAVPGRLVPQTETPADGAGSDDEPRVSPGIRLSPILRLVSHPSGLRVQLRAGAPVAAALVGVMTPAVEAAMAGLSPAQSRRPGPSVRPSADRAGRGGRGGGQGGLRLLRRRRRDPGGVVAAGAVRGEEGDGREEGERSVASALSVSNLARRGREARRVTDREEALAVDRDLCSLHRHTFTSIRPPVVTPFVPMTAAERSEVRQQALAATGATAKGLSRARRAELQALSAEQVSAFVRASNLARRVLADRREALASLAWQLLEAHDPAVVVTVVDEALRSSGSDVTCLDAGGDPVTDRAYVTVLVRFPTISIVAKEWPHVALSGRTTWRRRTPGERNGVYAAGLASVVLAAAKQVVSIAPATDDVNVVVVRPTPNGHGVEPVYVGRLDREDVSLRHPDADPLPIVISSALPDGIRIHGPEREVGALDPAGDADGALREIVEACRVAEATRMPSPGSAPSDGPVPPAG
ncbi:hypothetical protein [Terrabacter sp. Ter38]|uniref:hypothetical protein n=1 Tax=Terrabacter sp. Ter38 TaxID=2926030 RepID=UPI002118E067|nr:hypothetical protein [Terrabacter sp. Ter38]